MRLLTMLCVSKDKVGRKSTRDRGVLYPTRDMKPKARTGVTTDADVPSQSLCIRGKVEYEGAPLVSPPEISSPTNRVETLKMFLKSA